MNDRFDVLVSGAALNGLAAAVALGGGQLRRPLSVAIIDAKDPRGFSTDVFDGRASAIGEAARRMFEALGLWEGLAKFAQPMSRIEVTDSRTDGAARPVLLSFAEDGEAGRASAYMVENRHLYAALLTSAQNSPYVTFVTGSAISGYRPEAGWHWAICARGDSHAARLVVAADGRQSLARAKAGIETVGWDYDQAGIVTTIEHEFPHDGTAEEHFRPPGPFAILPLIGKRSSIVWTENRATARALMDLPDPQFLAELGLRFGTHRGKLHLAGPRHSYPLGLSIAKSLTASRLALVGDAAHVVHPIAGLGFNLGLRDVAALAEVVHEAAGLGEDIGSPAVLERYSEWRRFDTVMTAAAMDGLNRLFANDLVPIRAFRDAGISIVDRLPALKAAFAREAAGQAGSLPRLMRGIGL